MNPSLLRACRAALVTLATAAAVVACSSATRWDDQPPQRVEPVTDELPRSKSGNPPFYEVYGVRYSVMDTSIGYKERGVASWYGKKFHGRSTSSGERYDMYQMTAAHKTLPLPTIARVTNLSNGRSIIVRVNDRGPFVKNRIIDLSYAAAIELDMTRDGTALVEVEALTKAQASAPQATRIASTAGGSARMYVQVGAFGEPGNAQRLANKLNGYGINNVAVHESVGENPLLYRVRIGPVNSVVEYDRIVREVSSLQISETHLVVEDL